MAEDTVLVPEKALGASLGKLTQKELVCLVKKLCEIATEQCGENGFRGGFRPGNIYIKDGVVTVGPADKAGEDGWTKDELEYMAPEVFWNGKKSAHADVYSIGLILFVGLNCGNVPFVPMADYKPTPEMRANALRTRMNGEPVVLPDSVDAGLREICEKAVAFDGDERYADTKEFLAALRAYSADEPPVSKKAAEAETAAAAKPAAQKNIPQAKAKTESASQKKGEKPLEPAAEPVTDEKPAKKRLTKYQKKSRSIRIASLIIIALFLCGVAAAGELTDHSLTEKPVPTAEPTSAPTVEPTVTPTVEPTVTPTPTPPPEPVYELITADISWDRAEQKCRESGGHLVTIRNAEDLAKVCELLDGTDLKYVWIGCYRNNADIFTWVSGEEVDYYAWAPGEPSEVDAYDGANEDYFMLVRQADGSWLYNDSRMDPFENYAKFYTGQTAYICQHG